MIKSTCCRTKKPASGFRPKAETQQASFLELVPSPRKKKKKKKKTHTHTPKKHRKRQQKSKEAGFLLRTSKFLWISPPTPATSCLVAVDPAAKSEFHFLWGFSEKPHFISTKKLKSKDPIPKSSPAKTAPKRPFSEPLRALHRLQLRGGQHWRLCQPADAEAGAFRSKDGALVSKRDPKAPVLLLEEEKWVLKRYPQHWRHVTFFVDLGMGLKKVPQQGACQVCVRVCFFCFGAQSESEKVEPPNWRHVFVGLFSSWEQDRGSLSLLFLGGNPPT